MIKVDIISGFLGAGKTTLIKKLFSAKQGKEKIALIENEFGEIGIDSGFLKESGIEIKEINSGCICCSLVGNFEESLKELISTYELDRIIIEPSGVGKLSDVISAIIKADERLKINIVCAVVDGGKVKMYVKNFGEFYIDQIEQANTIVVSKTDKLSEQKVIEACEQIKVYNPTATMITTPITQLEGQMLVENLEDSASLIDMLIEDVKKHSNHGHREHHHEHGEDCHCHEHEHHHEHGEDCHCHEHHHEHGEDCHCHEHEHHHEHGEDCHCHEHEHHHEHGEGCCCHHTASEVFEDWGTQTPKSYSKDKLEFIMQELSKESYGVILRSKGIVKASDNDKWYYFDFVAGDYEIRLGEPDVIGKLCVIGSKIDKNKIKALFLD